MQTAEHSDVDEAPKEDLDELVDLTDTEGMIGAIFVILNSVEESWKSAWKMSRHIPISVTHDLFLSGDVYSGLQAIKGLRSHLLLIGSVLRNGHSRASRRRDDDEDRQKKAKRGRDNPAPIS